jgi:hypothetical protein
MKSKVFIYVLIAIVFGTFSSCDLFDKAGDVSFDVVLPLNFAIDENADNPGGMSYSDTKLLDATTNPDVAKYSSKIKEFKINKVTYTITSVDPSGVTFSNGSVVVTSSGTTIATANSVGLAEMSDVQLNANTDGFNDLAAKLLDDKKENVNLMGTFSKTPIAFNVKFDFYVTVTANPL